MLPAASLGGSSRLSPSSASFARPVAAPPGADAANPAASPCPVPGQCSHGPAVSVPSAARGGAQPRAPGFGSVGSRRVLWVLGFNAYELCSENLALGMRAWGQIAASR